MTNTVIRSEDFFFSRGQFTDWKISNNAISAMKELVSKYYEGAYVEKGLEYSCEDNIEILDKYRGIYDRDVFMSYIGLGMQLLVRVTRKDDIKGYDLDIEDYHIALLNRLYIEHDSYENIIYSGDKRPFGNSYILGDILEEYKRKEYEESMDEDDDKFREENESKAWEIYYEVIELAKYVIKTYPVKFTNFSYCGYDTSKLLDLQLPYYNHAWVPSILEFRDQKIDQILAK